MRVYVYVVYWLVPDDHMGYHICASARHAEFIRRVSAEAGYVTHVQRAAIVDFPWRWVFLGVAALTALLVLARI